MTPSRKSVLVLGFVGMAIVASVLFARAFIKPEPDAAVPSDPKGPVLAFAQTEFDFGEVYEGQQIVHRFPFRNAGAEELQLDPIVVNVAKASCSLPNSLTVTVPPFSDTDTVVVQPGAAGEIVTTLETDGFGQAAFDGNFSQRIRVYSNDPGAPRTVLHIKGRVKPTILRDPVEVSMGAVFKEAGQLPTRLPPVRLTAAPGQSFEITRIESNSPYFDPTFSKAADGAFVVTTAIDPAIPEGPVGDVHLVVHTTNPHKPTVVIPVSGQVYPERPVAAAPEFVDFGLLRPGEPASATILLAKGEFANWNVLATRTKGTGASVDASLTRVGSGYSLTVSVKPSVKAWASFSGEVEVTTDTKARPKVVVPFFGWTYGDAPFAYPAERLKAFVSEVLGHDMLQQPQLVLTKVLTDTQHPAVFPLLHAIAREGDLQAAIRASELLVRVDPVKAVPALEGIVRSEAEELVRDEALAAYFAVARERSLPLLLDALQDQSRWVREQAATLLGELGDERAKPALLKASRDKIPDVALAAVEALEQFFDPAVREQHSGPAR